MIANRNAGCMGTNDPHNFVLDGGDSCNRCDARRDGPPAPVDPLAEARAVYGAACRAYNPVRLAYQRREVGDAEFLAARRVYEAAGDAYDAAIDAAKGGAR